MNATLKTPVADAVSCPLCGAHDAPANLALSGGRVLVQCAQCAGRFELGARPTPRAALRLVPVSGATPGATLTPGANPFSPPGTCCPKCASPRRSLRACASCGADFSKLDVAALQPPAWLRERWGLLWTAWDDVDGHAALLEEATLRDALPQLARLYRVRLAWAVRDARGEAALAEVVKRAALPLVQTLREDPGPKRRRLMFGGLVVLSSLLLGVLSLMAR